MNLHLRNYGIVFYRQKNHSLFFYAFFPFIPPYYQIICKFKELKLEIENQKLVSR